MSQQIGSLDSAKEEKFIRMTTQPVEKLINRLAVPTIISMLVTSFYNLADTFFVRHLEQDSMVAAVGVVLPLMNIIQAIGFYHGHGSGNYISRAFGRRDLKDAEKMAATGFFCAVLFGLALAPGHALHDGQHRHEQPAAHAGQRLLLHAGPGQRRGAEPLPGPDPDLPGRGRHRHRQPPHGLRRGHGRGRRCPRHRHQPGLQLLHPGRGHGPQRQCEDPPAQLHPHALLFQGHLQGRPALPGPPGHGQHRHRQPEPRHRPLSCGPAAHRRGPGGHDRREPDHDVPVRLADRLRTGLSAGLRL